MNNMRRGFTMIELIFVIVIIGILAAVAIPKLAATRDDAKISNIIANSRTFLGDLGAFYTAQGSGGWDNNASVKDVSNVNVLAAACAPVVDLNQTVISPTTFTLCDDLEVCAQFVTSAGGVLNITTNAASTSPVCQNVATDPAMQAMVNGSPHTFGGSTVSR